MVYQYLIDMVLVSMEYAFGRVLNPLLSNKDALITWIFVVFYLINMYIIFNR